MDLVGTQLPGLNDLLNLDDSDLAAGRRQRIEVLGGIAIHHVAITVGLPALDDGEVGAEGFLEDIRSEEHTSELQSRPHLVCRLLLEKKKKKKIQKTCAIYKEKIEMHE